jgi:GNAT superfamily N-acetyltransferase
MPHADRDTLHALVESLFDNPFYQAVTIDFERDTARRKQVLESYFEYSLLEAERTGRLVVSPASEAGAALWQLPQDPEAAAVESDAKMDFMSTLFGPRGTDRYHRILEFMEAQMHGLIPADAWYLSILGVHPNAQGRGTGARLLAPTMQEANDAGVSCYLETFGDRGLPFYERVGFQRIATHVEPTTGGRYHILRTVG